ncbi:MAG: hypothetical protein P8M02_03915, partial [Flavobacteriaceae bacterium]|nr:hypothetical protein [Flavobacteriaceae bacterium]
MPSGLQSSISSGTLTISGTPVFTNNDYSFSVFTTDGNANCSQVSQTVTLSKKDSPLLTLISGAYNQTITLGDSMQPIVFSFGGSTTSVTITGPEPQDISQSGNTITIFAGFDDTGTNTGTITTISSGGCNEITQSIAVTVNAPVVTNTGGGGGTTTGGTSSGGTATGGTTTTNSGVSTISCQSSILDDLGTFIVVSSLSKNSDGTGDLTIDDFKFSMVTQGGSVNAGFYRPSSIDNISKNCSSGNLYTLSGPLILLTDNMNMAGFNVGQSYTISQLSDLYEDYYLLYSFGFCESGSACEIGKIGRVDVQLRGFDSSGSLINFNQSNATLFKCAVNNPSNLPNFIRYSLNANGCGQL